MKEAIALLLKKLNNDDRDQLPLVGVGLFWAGICLGAILRFSNLDAKPASSIEIATIGYSLGHGFKEIALDQLLSLDVLLAPLRFESEIGYREVLARLTAESTHPPLYFWLTHWWLNLWTANGELVSLQAARSLSAICGILTIPATFYLSWISFRCRLTAHLAALLTAISPYGIYLAQEARHYTLTILWLILAFTCLIKSLQAVQKQATIPLWLSCVWIILNALGVATHYFFVLALFSQAIAISVFYWQHRGKIIWQYGRGIILAMLGTCASCLVWLPLVKGISDNELTSWIATNYEISAILLPIPRLVGWIASMFFLLPIEGVPKAIAILSMLIMASVAIYALPKLRQSCSTPSSFNNQVIAENSRLIFGVYVISAIAFFLVLIYGMGKDISLAARYHFVYFPVLIMLVAQSLANCWQQSQAKKVVLVLLIMGFLGALTVISNYGFQKSRYSNRLSAFIQANSTNPAIVAMRYNTNSETRELMSIAYAFSALSIDQHPPQFLLNRLHIDGQDMGLFNIDRALDNQPRPLDFWAINLAVGEADMNRIQCYKNQDVDLSSVQSGYRDRLYLCQQRIASSK